MRGKTVVVPVSEMLRAHVATLGDGGQTALADELGTSGASVSRWINGLQVPGEEWVRPLARSLKVPVADVRSAVALSRAQLQDAKDEQKRRAIENEELRRLRATVEELVKRLQQVEQRLAATERRRRSEPPTEPGPR